MKLTVQARQITAEIWVATLILNEENKASNSRDFIVDLQQLAFLRAIERAME